MLSIQASYYRLEYNIWGYKVQLVGVLKGPRDAGLEHLDAFSALAPGAP